MDVAHELLPDHPIVALKATTTDRTMGIHNGEVMAYRCIECGAADEDVFELVHDEDCKLAGASEPHGYDTRGDGCLGDRPTLGEPVATDGSGSPPPDE
jgi:hypothetical protein